MLELVLQYNIFEHDSTLYRLQIGTSMGSKPAPDFSNIFMARRIDYEIRKIARKYTTGNLSLKMFKHYLDDILAIFIGSTQSLHKFIQEINKIHPAIRLTMSHTSIPGEANDLRCSCLEQQSVPYLDTSLSMKNGKISVDLYKKPTDRNQYLLPSSCHPNQTTQNIPFSLALRIVRVCTRFQELKSFLLEREYKPGMINSAINKARIIPRNKALKKKKTALNKHTRRPVMAVNWDPRLPSIPSIQLKHWRSMCSQNPNLEEVFKEPPLTAYKRQKNIRDYIVRAKVTPQLGPYPKRQLNGMVKCGKSCIVCPFIKEGKHIKAENLHGTLTLR